MELLRDQMSIMSDPTVHKMVRICFDRPPVDGKYYEAVHLEYINGEWIETESCYVIIANNEVPTEEEPNE